MDEDDVEGGTWVPWGDIPLAVRRTLAQAPDEVLATNPPRGVTESGATASGSCWSRTPSPRSGDGCPTCGQRAEWPDGYEDGPDPHPGGPDQAPDEDQHERLAEGKRLAASEEAELRQEVFRMTVARQHEWPTLPAWVIQGMHSRGWMLIRTPIEAETIALAEVAAPEPEQAEEPEESGKDSKAKSAKKGKGK